MSQPEVPSQLPEVYVQPGEAVLVTQPTILKTLLGSCVGVAFWIPRLGIGALCHPMLPACPVLGSSRLSPAAGRRYVDFAIRDLAHQFDDFGARRSEVQTKLFGGCDVLVMQTDSSHPTVGRLNSEAALKVLEKEGLGVVASSLGGDRGINIQFHTGTGEVLLKRHS